MEVINNKKNINVEKVIKTFKENKINYIECSYNNSPNKDFYITNDYIVFDKEEFFSIENKLHTLNNIILKKAVYYMLKFDNEGLKKIGFTENMSKFVLDIFNKKFLQSWEKLNLSFIGRYDILVDKEGKFKLIELNAETPAGIPEVITTNQVIKELIDDNNLIYSNNDFDKLLFTSLFPKLKEIIDNKDKKNSFLVIFSNDNTNDFLLDGEDYVNSLYITEFFKRQLEKHGIEVKLGNVDDVEFKKDGIYFENIRQDYIWSFYPMEWFFTDNGSKEFIEFYKNGIIELINNPLTLIPQSKGFWSYLFEIIEKDTGNYFTKSEIEIIKEIIPKYYYEKPEGIKTISKPPFYREGVGIGDDLYLGIKYYQELIEQKEFNINKLSYKDGKYQKINEKGYLTLGFYFGESGFIGSYNRFCKNIITNSESYFIPLLIK